VSPDLYGRNPSDLVLTAKPPSGTHVIVDARPWTMFEALMMLDAWLGWRQARTPFDGWAGGGYISYEKDGAGGPLCFTTLTAFDTPESAASFADAVSWWAAASGSSATPLVANGNVSFEACERGEGAADPPRPVVSTSEAAMMEDALLHDAEPAATAEDELVERCVARTLVDDPELAALFWEETLTADQWVLVDRHRAEARWSCVESLRGG
jgi:hypothetical protein